jgi:hypothetical protein
MMARSGALTQMWHSGVADTLEGVQEELRKQKESVAALGGVLLCAEEQVAAQEEELRLLRAIHEAASAPSPGPPYWADVLDAYRAWKEKRG